MKNHHSGTRWCSELDDEQPETPCGKDGICKLDGRKVGRCVICGWCVCGTANRTTNYGIVHICCIEKIGTYGLSKGWKIIPEKHWTVIMEVEEDVALSRLQKGT